MRIKSFICFIFFAASQVSHAMTVYEIKGTDFNYIKTMTDSVSVYGAKTAGSNVGLIYSCTRVGGMVFSKSLDLIMPVDVPQIMDSVAFVYYRAGNFDGAFSKKDVSFYSLGRLNEPDYISRRIESSDLLFMDKLSGAESVNIKIIIRNKDLKNSIYMHSESLKTKGFVDAKKLVDDHCEMGK